jgi:hypothetical protein
MKRNVSLALVAIVCLLSAVGSLHAGTIYYTNGALIPHFADGDTPDLSIYNAAVSSQAAPFNGFIGNDVDGPDFDATWTHVNPATANITAATLQLGIWDHDTLGASDPVALFTLNGVDLTTDLNTLFTSYGGANNEYNSYTLVLPLSTFPSLEAGSAVFHLTLADFGLGSGGFGTDFNGAGLDFAKLGITTPDSSEVPEPATASLLILGLAGIGVAALRRRRV